jgi:hypothetical protein
MALHFRYASAHIGIFELPRTSVSGQSGQTGASLDVRARLAGSADENIGLMTGMSARSLTELHHVVAAKSSPLHFQKCSVETKIPSQFPSQVLTLLRAFPSEISETSNLNLDRH